MNQPASVTRLIWTQCVLVLLGVVTVVLTRVLRDDLVRSWAEGHGSVSRTLASGGLDAVEAGDITPPAFVPVAIVLFVVLASLLWVLTSFVRLGYAWARLTISGLLAFMAIATVAGIRTGPPTVFVVLAVVSFAIEAIALAFLWHRDTTAHMAGTWAPADTGADRSL